MEITKRQMDIVEATISIIAQLGYDRLTTKKIAAHLDLTEAALYRHFASKSELIKMVLCYFEHLSCEVIERIKVENLSPIESVRRFVLDRYELFTSKPDLAMVMFSEEIFKTDHSFMDDYQSIMHIHREHVVGFIQKGQELGDIAPDLDPVDIFRITVGSMRLLVSQWNFSHHGFDLKSEGEKLLNTIMKLIEVKK